MGKKHELTIQIKARKAKRWKSDMAELRREVDELRTAIDIKNDVTSGVAQVAQAHPEAPHPCIAILGAVVVDQYARSAKKGSREARVLQRASSMLAAESLMGILESIDLPKPG